MTAKLIVLRPPDDGPGLTEAELVAGCADGDESATAELFDRYVDVVYRFVARMTSPAERDDVVQTTFLQVFRSARAFEGRSSVQTWILAIAANVVRQHARGEARRRRAMSAVAREHRPMAVLPDRLAAERERLRAVEEAIAALSPKLREVFVLVELESLRGREAAEALGIPEGTVWRRLHRAREALRAALDRFEGGD